MGKEVFVKQLRIRACLMIDSAISGGINYKEYLEVK